MGGEHLNRKGSSSFQDSEKGITFLQLMVVIAIVAILAAIAIPNWVEEVQQSGYQTTLEEGQSAVRMLNIMALQGQGAVLTQAGSALTISSNSGEQWSGHMPQNGQLLLNGNVVSMLNCLSLNGMGIPATNVTNPPCGNSIDTAQWSVIYANKAPIAITSSTSSNNVYD